MAVSRNVRRLEKLYRKQNGLCYLCGGGMKLAWGFPNSATIEHVTPKSVLNGLQAENNHKAACFSCNQKKGSRHASDYLAEQRALQRGEA